MGNIECCSVIINANIVNKDLFDKKNRPFCLVLELYTSGSGRWLSSCFTYLSGSKRIDHTWLIDPCADVVVMMSTRYYVYNEREIAKNFDQTASIKTACIIFYFFF